MIDRKISREIATKIFRKEMAEYGDFLVENLAVSSANCIFSVSIKDQKRFIIKIYNKQIQRAVPGKERLIHSILDNKSEHVISVIKAGFYENMEFIITPFIDGRELLSLVEDKSVTSAQLKGYSEQVISYIQDCTSYSTKGYGFLDDHGRGISKEWKYFLQENLDSVKKSFDKIITAYGESYRGFLDSIAASLKKFIIKYDEYFCSIIPKLTPVDLNLCNFIIDNSDKVFAVDLESFVSGDPMFSYGEFIGHVFQSRFHEHTLDLWENWTSRQKEIIHFYALLCNTNVFSFCALRKIELSDTDKKLESIFPWGNLNSFFELMSLHQEIIDECIIKKI